jgi:hypothetical protein
MCAQQEQQKNERKISKCENHHVCLVLRVVKIDFDRIEFTKLILVKSDPSVL